MSKLTIHEWSGRKREVEFCLYNRDHTACLIKDENGDRRAIVLHLPDRFDLRFREKTVAPTSSPPTSISPRAVHLPACFSSQKEDETWADTKSPEARQTLTTNMKDAWKVLTPLRISLEPKDDERLLALWRDGGGDLTRVTVEELRRGYGGVREKLLEQEWAERNGLDLQEIPVASRVFRRWVENSAYRVTPAGEAVSLSLAPYQWEVLEACVQYEMQFEMGRRCWLNGIEERALTDPQEIDDFDRFEADAKRAQEEELLKKKNELEAIKAQNVAAETELEADRRQRQKEDARLAQQRARHQAAEARKALQWHNGDFQVIERHNAKGDVVDQLPLPTEFRALCHLLAIHPNATAQFSKIEPDIGNRTRELDLADRRGTMASPPGERRLRDLLRTKTGKKLVKWGVLSVKTVGRQKFLSLSPPKPVK